MISTTLTTFNRFDYTKLTIESYLATTTVEHELIVVDNASKDETIPYLQDLYANKKITQLFLNKKNKFPAYATNQGWSAANKKAEFLHRSDNDLVYKKGWDLEVIQAFKDIPNLGQLGLINELYQLAPAEHDKYLKSVNIQPRLFNKTAVMYPPNPLKTVGGPCVVPRKVFDKIKWPNDEWMGNVNEDVKYSQLIEKAGYKIYELISERVHHLGYGDIQSKYMNYYIETFARRNYYPSFMQRLQWEILGKIKNNKVIS